MRKRSTLAFGIRVLKKNENRPDDRSLSLSGIDGARATRQAGGFNFVTDEIASIHAALTLVIKLTQSSRYADAPNSRVENVVGGRARRASTHSDLRFSLDYFFQ
jgi:hypothetical protein